MNPFESHLSAFLDRYLEGPPHLDESIRYSLLAPGKRIRPRLTLSTARMIGLSETAAMPAAISIEALHCFTLIHDDLPCMDDDDFRRGQPSNHKKFGEATALLAGDALMALAWDSLLEASEYVKAEGGIAALRAAFRRLAWAAGPRGVIGGQARESLLGPGSTLADLRRMHAGKTGALFSAAILLPMDLAAVPGDSPEARSLETFASELGLAFQVADDLEDAPEEQTRTGQITDPTNVLFFQSASDARQEILQRLRGAGEALARAWGKDRSTELIDIALEVEKKVLSP